MFCPGSRQRAVNRRRWRWEEKEGGIRDEDEEDWMRIMCFFTGSSSKTRMEVHCLYCMEVLCIIKQSLTESLATVFQFKRTTISRYCQDTNLCFLTVYLTMLSLIVTELHEAQGYANVFLISVAMSMIVNPRVHKQASHSLQSNSSIL